MSDNDAYLIVSVHDFKTNLSKYLRMLHCGEVRGVIVRRYKRKIAYLSSLVAREREARECMTPQETGLSPPT